MSSPAAEARRLAAEVAALGHIEVETRLRLLRVHAFKLCLVGILVLAYGGAQSLEDFLGTWTRGVIGFTALAGGILIAAGVHLRHLRTQAAGLILAGLWDVAMGAAFLAAFIVAGASFAPTPFWESTPPDSPALYPAVVYAALASMVWGVHLVTVLRLMARTVR